MKDAGPEGEKKRESRMSGFFNLIKSRTSMKSPPTSPHSPTPTPTNSSTPSTTEHDNVESTKPAVKSPVLDHTPEPVKTQVQEKADPCEPVDTATTSESKGHAEEGKKREGPQGGRIRGVQVMGNDFLAQLRAKQEKMKEKVSETNTILCSLDFKEVPQIFSCYRLQIIVHFIYYVCLFMCSKGK